MSTYFIDIDGTIVPHLEDDELDNLMKCYKENPEQLLDGVLDFFSNIKKEDTVIFTTARFERHRELTEYMLNKYNIPYTKLIMDLPSGCRILINDSPYPDLDKAIGITVKRDVGLRMSLIPSELNNKGYFI